MTTYKTVIIEDNPDNATVIRKILTKNHPELTIVAEADSVESAKEILLTHKPDIALMDIELTPGTSFDVLDSLNQTESIDFEIIFITAHQRYDYATKAIDFSSLAFLSKPIDPELLRGAIEKAKEKQTQKIQIDQLLTRLKAIDERNTKIIIPTSNNRKVAIKVADITHFEADGTMTKVHLLDNSTLIAFRNLGHFEKMVEDDYPFFRIHNSFLVNVAQIKAVSPVPQRVCLEITLANGIKLQTSKQSTRSFRLYWENYHNINGNIWQRLRNLFR